MLAMTMYIELPDGQIEDAELEQLCELLAVLERQNADYAQKRAHAYAPEQNVYWYRISYVVGLAFVVCQQYINDTRRSARVPPEIAMALPPLNSAGVSIVAVVNAAANCWKHYVEDVDLATCTLHASTQKVLQSFGVDLETPYAMEGVLDRLVGQEPKPLMRLSNCLVEWRTNLIKSANHAPQGTARGLAGLER